MCRPTRAASANANSSGNNNAQNMAPSPSPPAAAPGLRRSRPSASSLVVLASPPPVLPNDLTSTAVILPDNSTAVSFAIEVQFRTVPGRWQLSEEDMRDIWYIEEDTAPEHVFRNESRDTIKIIRRNRGSVDALDPTKHTVRGIEHLLTLEALTQLAQEKTASVRSVLDAVGSTIAAPFSDELRRISMEATRGATERARQRGLQDEADAHAIFHPPLRNHPSGTITTTSTDSGRSDGIIQDALTAAAAAAIPATSTMTMALPSASSPLQAAAAAAVQVPQEGVASTGTSRSDTVCSVSPGSDGGLMTENCPVMASL